MDRKTRFQILPLSLFPPSFPLLSQFGRIYESIRTQRYSKIRGTYPAPCSTTSSAQWTLNFRPVTRWITPDDPWTFGLASFQPSLPSSLHESSSIQLCFQLSEEFVWNLSTPVVVHSCSFLLLIVKNMERRREKKRYSSLLSNSNLYTSCHLCNFWSWLFLAIFFCKRYKSDNRAPFVNRELFHPVTDLS